MNGHGESSPTKRNKVFISSLETVFLFSFLFHPLCLQCNSHSLSLVMNLDHLTRSAVATAAAELATLPICTVKTWYQNHGADAKPPSVVDSVKEIYKKSGYWGFVRASIPGTCSQVLSTSSKYFLYKAMDTGNNELGHKMARGLVSGWISSILTHPLDTCRVHMQKHKPVPRNLKELYSGFSKTISKVGMGSMIYFPLFEYLHETHHMGIASSSFVTAVVGVLFTQPLDYMKTRQMFQLNYRIRDVYRGTTLNFARVVPHFFITMTCIKWLEQI